MPVTFTGVTRGKGVTKRMENDAGHNVGRMKLDHAPTQVAPPRFLVMHATVLRHDTADASISVASR